MKWLLPIVLAAFASGCAPVGDGGASASTSRTAAAQKNAASAPIDAGETIFLGTVTGVDPGNTKHHTLKWVVTLKIDKVVAGPDPGKGFRFAIHSPSQEGIKIGQRLRITAQQNGDGYDLISRDQVD